MLKEIRANIFYIGILIFSLTLFVEHLFIGETNITCFIKGFACNIQIVGVVILIKKNNLRGMS